MNFPEISTRQAFFKNIFPGLHDTDMHQNVIFSKVLVNYFSNQIYKEIKLFIGIPLFKNSSSSNHLQENNFHPITRKQVSYLGWTDTNFIFPKFWFQFVSKRKIQQKPMRVLLIAQPNLGSFIKIFRSCSRYRFRKLQRSLSSKFNRIIAENILS